MLLTSQLLPAMRLNWITLTLASIIPLVVSADEPRPILPEAPHLHPDGTRLAFAWNGDLWEVGIDGGRCRRLTAHPAEDTQPRYSPDGHTLAFVSDRNGSKQIFVMPADGGLAEQRSFHSEDYTIADWFPDGKSLLALSARDHFWKQAERLIQVSLDASVAEKVLLDAHATQASISPDGKSILLSREGERWWRKGYRGERASQIWRLDLDSNSLTELLHEGYECRSPIWLPNQRGFYFTMGTDNGANLYRYRFPKKSAATSEPNKEKVETPASEQAAKPQPKKNIKPIASFEEDSIVQPTLSPDGKVLVFRHLFDLYRLRLGVDESPVKLDLVIEDDSFRDDRLRRTFAKANQVAFTDDGLDIAFTAAGDIWFMDTELKEPIQATKTPGEEKDIVFSPDAKSLWFTRAIDGLVDVWKLEPRSPKLPWWRQTSFHEYRITDSPVTESSLKFSPDGKYLLFQESTGDLIAWNIEEEEKIVLYDGFGDYEADISPDSHWVAFSRRDEFFNSDIWLMPIDGSRLPVNVSKHPDNDYDPTFSPDGKILAFTGTRSDDEVDIHYVYLDKRTSDESSRDRKLQQALEILKKRKSIGTPETKEKSQTTSKPSNSEPSGSEKTADKEKQLPERIRVDLDDIHERVRRIGIEGSSDRSLIFSPDSRKLVFEATVDGKEGLYSVEFPDKLEPKLFSSTQLSQKVWPKSANALLGLNKDVPSRINDGDKLVTYSFSAKHEASQKARFREGFQAAWLMMRDVWYDEKLAGKNWDEIRRKYSEAAANAPDVKTFTTVIELMLGELNGSHLGFTPTSASLERAAWRTEVAHLGVRWEPGYQGPGLKIRDVLPNGPADRRQSQLLSGDIVLTIDQKAVDPAMDLIPLLTGTLDRDIRLKVQRPTSKNDEETNALSTKPARDFTVTVRPISYAAARILLYEHWLDHNRQLVDKLSDGKLGYLHIRAMDTSSFYEFETQLYRVGYGRQGLVIDVRDNGGGSTTDLLLTALTQPQHAFTIPRNGRPGYPQDRLVFASWTKPIIVLCNQNSFSNAEIFSHAIKELGRGKVVGVQTAGGVVSTGAAPILDLGTLRIPFRGWFSVSSGKDMELRGALPDIVLWPQPTDLPEGRDPQLEAAVKQLLKDLVKVKELPPADYAIDPP